MKKLHPLIFALIFLPFTLAIVRTQRSANNGCERLHIANETLRLPSYLSSFTLPWRNPALNAHLYSSQILTYNWNWFKGLQVQGLGWTFEEILELFDQNNCFFVGYGDGVRNILLGTVKTQSLLKISGESNCDALKLYSICKSTFGDKNCGTEPLNSKDKITIGNSHAGKSFDDMIIGPITLNPWNSSIPSDRLKWSYTVNTCGIFDDRAGKVYFIDISGQSQDDICRHHVVNIPVQVKYWEDWTHGSLSKVLDVYTILPDGFVINQREARFLKENIRTKFDASAFQDWYCHNVLGGSFYPFTLHHYPTKRHTAKPLTCHYLTPDERRSRLIRLVNQTLHEDMGDFYDSRIEPALRGMPVTQFSGTFGTTTRKTELPSKPRVISYPAQSFQTEHYRHNNFKTEIPTTLEPKIVTQSYSYIIRSPNEVPKTRTQTIYQQKHHRAEYYGETIETKHQYFSPVFASPNYQSHSNGHYNQEVTPYPSASKVEDYDQLLPQHLPQTEIKEEQRSVAEDDIIDPTPEGYRDMIASTRIRSTELPNMNYEKKPVEYHAVGDDFPRSIAEDY